MVYNFEKQEPDLIKVINSSHEITTLNYGPYDNGHVMVGFSNGSLASFNYTTLERLCYIKVFSDEAPITCINFDPTNLIFVGGVNGKVAALSWSIKKMNYLYLDLGKS
jgi:hypothetical protein